LNPPSSRSEEVEGPDPNWGGLYKAGGISAILYVTFGLILPAIIFLTTSYDASMNGEEALQFIGSHRLWWIVVQNMTLMPSFFAIIAFVSLFAAIKHIYKGFAAVGAAAAIVSQTLFLMYLPVVQGMLYMSDRYAEATLDTEREMLAVAAEALVAQNSATSYIEIVFGVGVLLISIVMLKGVFHKGIAYLGIAAFAASVIGMALQPIFGIGYFWWWFVFMIWFIAVGWQLYGFGKSTQDNEHTPEG